MSRTIINRLFIILSLAFIPVCALSQQVSPQTALQTAVQFRYSSGDGSRVSSRNAANVTLSYTANTGINNDFYVFNYPDNGGYVIVSADSRTVSPVLAYSDQGSFDPESIPDNAAYILQTYQKQIESIRNSDALTVPPAVAPQSPNVVVAPLIKTKWNQENPYYGMCPIDPQTGLRSCAGCVATSLAQILNYWKWPERGHGLHHNTIDTTLCVNFDESVYDWEHTLTEYKPDSESSLIKGIQKIMYDCGIAVNMQYSSNGSSAYTSAISTALYSYFDYKTTARLIYRDDLSDQENPDSVWISLIKKELDASRPVMYSGTDHIKGTGHSFICDGYDDQDRFHFNLGWGGYMDGYYLATAVKLTDGSECYDSYQDIVIGVEPDRNDGYNDGYVFCSLFQKNYAILEGIIMPYDNPGVLTLPNNVTINGKSYPVSIIDHSSFGDNYSITGIKFPSKVYQLGYWAFQNCPNLTTVEIPESVVYFGAGCFARCNNLKKLTVNSGNSYFNSPYNSNAVIETESNRLVQGCNYTVIPKSVVTIGENAFQGFDGIEEVTLTANIKTIEDDAFTNCRNLKKVYLNKNIKTLGERVFEGCSALTDVYSSSAQPPQIDASTFPSGITVHVTSDIVSAYRSDPVWSLFTIVADITDSVEKGVMPDVQDNEHHYYDIMGRKADSNSRLQISKGRKYLFR